MAKEICEERIKLAAAVASCTGEAYRLKAQSDANPLDQELKARLMAARNGERLAVRALSAHLENHGCKG
jgi:hypothetical protein